MYLPIENKPYQRGQVDSINGIGNTHQNNIGEIARLQNEAHRHQMETMKQQFQYQIDGIKQGYKHQSELDELKGVISTIREDNRDGWDRLFDKLEENIHLVEPFAVGLAGKLFGNGAQIAGTNDVKSVPRKNTAVIATNSDASAKSTEVNTEEPSALKENIIPDFNYSSDAAILLAQNGCDSEIMLRMAHWIVNDPKTATPYINQLPPIPDE